MKTYKAVVIENPSELDRAVELQFGLDYGSIDIDALFSSYPCDRFQPIYFDDNSLEEAEMEADHAIDAEDYNIARKTILVLTYLRDIFPNEEFVLYFA